LFVFSAIFAFSAVAELRITVFSETSGSFNSSPRKAGYEQHSQAG
jgi:hypothetical protein